MTCAEIGLRIIGMASRERPGRPFAVYEVGFSPMLLLPCIVMHKIIQRSRLELRTEYILARLPNRIADQVTIHDRVVQCRIHQIDIRMSEWMRQRRVQQLGIGGADSFVPHHFGNIRAAVLTDSAAPCPRARVDHNNDLTVEQSPCFCYFTIFLRDLDRLDFCEVIAASERPQLPMRPVPDHFRKHIQHLFVKIKSTAFHMRQRARLTRRIRIGDIFFRQAVQSLLHDML
ncbi:hypothetical protein D3C78_929640 [compost metagenome]